MGNSRHYSDKTQITEVKYDSKKSVKPKVYDIPVLFATLKKDKMVQVLYKPKRPAKLLDEVLWGFLISANIGKHIMKLTKWMKPIECSVHIVV